MVRRFGARSVRKSEVRGNQAVELSGSLVALSPPPPLFSNATHAILSTAPASSCPSFPAPLPPQCAQLIGTLLSPPPSKSKKNESKQRKGTGAQASTCLPYPPGGTVHTTLPIMMASGCGANGLKQRVYSPWRRMAIVSSLP